MTRSMVLKMIRVLTMLLGIIPLGLQSSNGKSYRWHEYLPSRETIYCYLTSSVAYAARSYQQAVMASLAMAGDPEAIQAWRELMATYTPSELLCMMGGQSLDQLAAGLSRILPNIPSMSFATRQALEMALYKGLQAVGVQ